MHQRQIDLVRDSFAYVVPITDEAAAIFYARLFALAPETRPLFKGDMAEQGRKLLMTLAMAVSGLSRLDDMLPVLRELAIRHAGYGVVDRHYDIVGIALLDMLAEVLGPAFDRETENAWGEAYTLLAGAMIAATRRAA